MKSNLCFRILIFALLISGCGKLNAQYASPSWAWSKAIYGTKLLESPATAVDPASGDVYTTGSYFGTVDFDPGNAIFNLDAIGIYADIFISKLDDKGNFVWAKTISPSFHGGSCRARSIKVDPSSGDVCITGEFLGSVDFDPGPGTYLIRNSGYPECNADVFVSKFDSAGNLKWAVSMGGIDDAWGGSIAVGPLGDIYILGSFNGKIDFNSEGILHTLTSVGEYDFFIAKLDGAGNFLWVKSIGGEKFDAGLAIAVDPQNGNVYITGDFKGQVNFNPVDSFHILNSGAAFDIFILKLDNEGKFVWVKSMSGPSSKGSIGYAIALDPGGSGDVYTTGYFKGEVDFNPDEEGIFNLNSAAGTNDIFISKLNSSGNFGWAKAIGGMGEDKGNAIAFDPGEDGGIYILGYFSQAVDLDPGPDAFHLTAKHGNDIFISKLNHAGDFEWAKPILANTVSQKSALSLDGQFLYMTGLFINPKISFDSLILTNPSNSENYWDVFIAKLNTTITTSVTRIYNHPFNIYPNPATNELTIEFDEGELFAADITLFNILGEVVYYSSDEFIGHKKIIDINTLAAGFYLVELNINGDRVVQKMVKE